MIGYCRVSTEEQAREGVSMEAQRKRLDAYCTAQGYELIGIESDNGTSGSVAPGKRPGLARALALVRKGEADGLLALKLDRISRNARDMLELVDDCRRQGWRLVSVFEQLDSGSAAGRLDPIGGAGSMPYGDPWRNPPLASFLIELLFLGPSEDSA
jgi:DNA invertase Pin-like site-specific DNA recombinase